MGLTGLASQALAAGYSRTDERGADKEGFNLCVKAGYNPYSMVLTINKLVQQPSGTGRTPETRNEAD